MALGIVLFYGGIILAAFFGILFFATWNMFEKKKKNLRRKIEGEY